MNEFKISQTRSQPLMLVLVFLAVVGLSHILVNAITFLSMRLLLPRLFANIQLLSQLFSFPFSLTCVVWLAARSGRTGRSTWIVPLVLIVAAAAIIGMIGMIGVIGLVLGVWIQFFAILPEVVRQVNQTGGPVMPAMQSQFFWQFVISVFQIAIVLLCVGMIHVAGYRWDILRRLPREPEKTDDAVDRIPPIICTVKE